MIQWEVKCIYLIYVRKPCEKTKDWSAKIFHSFGLIFSGSSVKTAAVLFIFNDKNKNILLSILPGKKQASNFSIPRSQTKIHNGHFRDRKLANQGGNNDYGNVSYINKINKIQK